MELTTVHQTSESKSGVWTTAYVTAGSEPVCLIVSSIDGVTDPERQTKRDR